MEGGQACPSANFASINYHGKDSEHFLEELAPDNVSDIDSTSVSDQNNNIEMTDKDNKDLIVGAKHENNENVSNGTGNTSANGRRLRTRNKNRKMFPEKVHHKRQTLQDMARPLKQWLYQNKDNPYPTKSQKHLLALNSHMSLVQVSNWFANARRRLKTVVKDPDLTWAKRVKLYNDHVVGNAELFSISSDDTVWDYEDEHEVQKTTFQLDQSQLISLNDRAASDDLVPSRTTTPILGHGINDLLSHVPEDFSSSLKYKQTILQRYLSDAQQRTVHVDERMLTQKRDRRQSGSMGSRDFEEMSTSSASSRINDVHHRVYDDFAEDIEFLAAKKQKCSDKLSFHSDDIRQKEMDAIFALTTLAKSRPT